MARGIVGIELPIARLEGKWKLSQTHARRLDDPSPK
jgi:predicted FMN-binding regulatory protein PaiB